MTDTELYRQPPPPLFEPTAESRQSTTWSRRRVLAIVCAGGAVSAAGPVWLLANRTETERPPRPLGRGRGTWTSFGSVAVLAAVREARHDAAAHLHGESGPVGGPLANRTWSTTVRVQVEVHNGSERAVLLSPGQFRLRIADTDTTVAPYDVGRPAAVVGPGRTVDTWVSYLAPAEESDLRLEYDDTGLSRPLDFRLSVAGLPATTLEGEAR
jgi:hypothetical protein